MKEQIILAPGCKGNELLRSLAEHGINCMNLRIMSAYGLAEIALMRSGITIEEDLIGPREEDAIISEAALQEEYFEDISFNDIDQIAMALRRARSLVADENEGKAIKKILSEGIFTRKNNALISIYEKYISELKNRNCIDSTMLIKRAILSAKEINAEFITLKEYPLSPMERALINKLSVNKVTDSDVASLFSLSGTTYIRIENYFNCHGAPNEVENVLSVIYGNYPVDKCTVAVTNPSVYAQLFFDYSLLYNIPMTFGTGIPIGNSNPAKLLKLYYHWMTDSLFSSASIKEMINSDVFDRSKMYDRITTGDDFSSKTFLEVLGNLKLTNKQDKNEKIIKNFEIAVLEEESSVGAKDTKAYSEIMKKKAVIPAIKDFADELSAPPEVFISRYAKVRKAEDTFAHKLIMKLDMAASSKIYNELSVVRASGISQTDEDIIKSILQSVVCAGRSEPGSLHIASINGAMTAPRENLFAIGLASSMFPGSPRENYLLLDDDLEKFGDGATYLLSEQRIERKKQGLVKLIELICGLDGRVWLSYSGLDVSELKKDNASSSMFEIYQLENGYNATMSDLESRMVNIAYFEPAISKTRKIGESYINDTRITRDTVTPIQGEFKGDLEKAYSPSALISFFGCPKSFFLNSIMGIKEPEDDKPFEIISAADSGTLAHTMMEILGENPGMSREAFLKLCSDHFERYIMEHTPLIEDDVDAKKEDFLAMMSTGYDMEPGNEIMMKEEDIECLHESGVKIHGFPDRVEKLKDGTYCVVDFKTGRNVEHIEDDVNTCIQVLIYAYILEKTRDIKVSTCEFRYIRLGQTVSCRYDDEIKAGLNEMLLEFKECMEKGEFEIPTDISDKDVERETCRYCKYGDICGKRPDWEVKLDE